MTAIPPLAGEIDAVIVQVQPVSIHGDVYYDLLLSAGHGEVRVRAPSHACNGAPEAGRRVRVRLLMRQVVAVEPLA